MIVKNQYADSWVKVVLIQRYLFALIELQGAGFYCACLSDELLIRYRTVFGVVRLSEYPPEYLIVVLKELNINNPVRSAG